MWFVTATSCSGGGAGGCLAGTPAGCAGSARSDRSPGMGGDRRQVDIVVHGTHAFVGDRPLPDECFSGSPSRYCVQSVWRSRCLRSHVVPVQVGRYHRDRLESPVHHHAYAWGLYMFTYGFVFDRFMLAWTLDADPLLLCRQDGPGSSRPSSSSYLRQPRAGSVVVAA